MVIFTWWLSFEFRNGDVMTEQQRGGLFGSSVRITRHLRHLIRWLKMMDGLEEQDLLDVRDDCTLHRSFISTCRQH